MSSESPKVMVPASGSTIADPRPRRPSSRAGIATTSPASGPGHRDVEERVAVPRGRAHADDRAEGAEQEQRRRRRDEVRQAHRRPVVARREVVAELVDAQDGEQRERERHAVEQPERRAERVEGHRTEASPPNRQPAARVESTVSTKSEHVDAGAASAPSRRRAATPGSHARSPCRGRGTACSRSGLKRGSSRRRARARGSTQELAAEARRRVPAHLLALDARRCPRRCAAAGPRRPRSALRRARRRREPPSRRGTGQRRMDSGYHTARRGHRRARPPARPASR